MEMLIQEDVDAYSSSWKIGVLFGFLTSCVSAISKLAIRKSWLMLEGNNSRVDSKTTTTTTAEHHTKLLLASRSMRWAGILGMSILNPAFDVVALSNANPSLLAPFSGLALAWIILLSEQLIGEPPQRIQICASGLIGFGLVLAMVFGDHTNNEDMTLEDVQASYREPILLAYFSCFLLWMGLLWYCINVSNDAVVQRFAWGVAGGSITGVQCFIKDALNVLGLSHDKRPWRLPWTFYILLALGIFMAVGGLSILTRCMKRYDVTFSNAMNAGSMVVSASIIGAVHHKTFSNLGSPWRATWYLIGLAIILVGLSILVRQTKELIPPGQGGDSEEDTIGELTDTESLELMIVEENAVSEEMAGLMPRKNSVTKPRIRSASSSNVSVEEIGGIVRRPAVHNFSPSTQTLRTSLVGNRDRTASSSSVTNRDLRSSLVGNRDRTASSSSVTNRDRTSSTSSLQF